GPAHVVCLLENDEVVSPLVAQLDRHAESGEPRPDDDDISLGVLGHPSLPPSAQFLLLKVHPTTSNLLTVGWICDDNSRAGRPHRRRGRHAIGLTAGQTPHAARTTGDAN